MDGPSPRDMDPLDGLVADHEGEAWLHVQWKDFVLGVEERIVRGEA